MSKNPFSDLLGSLTKFDARMSETPRAKTLEALAQRFGEATSTHSNNPKQAHRGHHRSQAPRRR